MPVTVFVVPGDLPPSGGARTASPPRLHTLAGGQPGSDGKCLSAAIFGRRAGDGFCRTRRPSAKRGGSYGLAPPACICSRGGQSGSDCKCLSRVLAGRSGKAVPVTVFVVPGDLPPSGGGSYGLAPPLAYARGGTVRVRRQVFVRISLEGAGRPCQRRFLSYPGTFRQAGGLVRPRPHACICARGGSPGQTASVRPAFQLEGVGRGRASNGFCRTRGASATRGGSYGLAPPLAYARGGAVRVRRQVFVSRFSWKP